MIRNRTSFGAVVAAIAAAGLATATPAEAATPVLAPAVAVPTAGTYNVVPQCTASIGVATNLNQITYVIKGDAVAYASDGTPAVATGITCKVIDRVTRATYGTVPPTAYPGSYATSVGLVTVPFNSDPMLCGYGNALFSNNATASSKTVGC